MAVSGSVSTTKYDGRYYTLSWTAEQSTADNQSTIKWTLKAVGGNSSWYAERTLKVVIDGETVYSKTASVDRYAGTVKTGSKVLKHNSSGEKSFKVEIEAAVYTSAVNCTGSKTFALTDIPREATITSASNFNDEGNPSLNYSNPAGSAAAVQVGLFWDSSTALIPYTTVTGTSGTKTFTLTTAQKEAIYSKLATAKSKTIYYYIKTVIGGTTFTSRVAKTVSITNATPTLSPTAIEDLNADTDGGDGNANIAATGSNLRWLKGISDVRYTFGAKALKGASIESYKVVCGSKSGSAAEGVLFNVDSGSVKFTVTDSRGNTSTKTLTRELVNYVRPTCNISATAVLDTSTTAKATIKINGNFFNGNIAADSKNTLALWYRYKEEGGSYNTWLPIDANISGNGYNITFELPETLDYQKAYTFQARAGDDLYSLYGNWVASNEVTVKAQPVFDWSKEDFNFNVPVTLSKNKPLQGIASDGSNKNLIYLTTGDSLQVGGGAYPPDNIYINTKDNAGVVAINGRQYGANYVLWSGGYYMSEGHDIPLSSPVSSTPNGIILVFSRYSDGAIDNGHFSCHFVPKIMVALQEGKGFIFNMSTSTEGYHANKYLYIYDTHIKGNANNITTDTGNTGVKYTNNAFVLRYVIGV